MNKTKVRNIEIYQIRRNDDGDFLFVIPAGISIKPIDHFRIEGDDLILMHENGDITRLYELPDNFVSRIASAEQINVVEIRDKQPVGEHTVNNAEHAR